MSGVVQFPFGGRALPEDVICFLIADFDDPAWLGQPSSAIGADAGADQPSVAGMVAAEGGRIFRTTATRLYCVFRTVGPAVATAFRMMRAEVEGTSGIRERRALRLGLHAGTAEVTQGVFVGATLNRAERLASAARPGQVLISAAAARMVPPRALSADTVIEPIGEFRLKDLLPPDLVYQLRHPELPGAFSAPQSLDATPNNLPLLSTYCIGRNEELGQLSALLERHQLVVVTGEGGVGKTRLALQCGAERLGQFPDGVWLVELEGLHNTGEIAETLCGLLGYKIGGDRTAAEILPTLIRRKRMMIILDQCERLPAPVAVIASALLRQCPEVRIIATSRHSLGMTEEMLMLLAGHGLPPAGSLDTGDVTQAQASAAVRLLIARARLAVPDFRLDPDNAATLGAICHELKGVALAIELVAPHLRRLTPREVLRALKTRLHEAAIDHGGPLDTPAVLRALLAWMHKSLSDDEAVTFGRFGVFGCMTAEAAGDIIGMSPLRIAAVPDTVNRLVECALLTRFPVRHGNPRFRMMTPVRDLALENFARDEARPHIMERFCDWLIRFFGEADRSWSTTPADIWLARYRPELDNLRAALGWAFGPDGNSASGLMLMSLTSELWRDIGLTVEQRHWLREAEARIGPATPERVAARIGLDIAFVYSGGAFGDRRKVEAALDALARYRAIGDRESVAVAAARVAVCVANPEDATAAQPYVDLMMAAVPGMKRGRRRGWLLNILAALAHFEGDAARAIVLLDEAVSISREFRDDVNIQIGGLNLGEILFAQGDPARAAVEAERVAASCRATGNLLDLSFALNNLAGYVMVLGDRARGQAALTEALALAAEINVELVLVACLQSAALMAAWQGEFETASRLAGHTDHYYQSHAIAREATEAAIHVALTGCLDAAIFAGAISVEHCEACRREGKAWDTASAVAAASRVLDS